MVWYTPLVLIFYNIWMMILLSTTNCTLVYGLHNNFSRNRVYTSKVIE